MRRIGLYSVVAIACLAVLGLLTAGIVGALNRGDEAPVEQANTPTVSEAPEPAPETTAEKSGEETKEEPAEEKNGQDEAGEGGGDRPPEEKSWREIAERRDAEQQAAEQQAAEQQAAEQQAAEQQAAEQRAAEEQAAAEEPVQPAAPSSSALSLSVPSIGIQNDPVTDSTSESVLANGAGKIPSTGFPWQQGANTYIAAHVYGYPGTGSWQQFADLPSMTQGDAIFLTDSNGTTYEYQVSEILTVAPTDVWAAESTGENIVSLQTCVGPGWSERLVVRGEMVGTSQA